MTGVGIVGLGFMGRTHINAYAEAARRGHANRLVAVCDASPERRAGRAGGAGNLEAGETEELMFDPSTVAATADPAELFANPEVELQIGRMRRLAPGDRARHIGFRILIPVI